MNHLSLVNEARVGLGLECEMQRPREGILAADGRQGDPRSLIGLTFKTCGCRGTKSRHKSGKEEDSAYPKRS